MRFLPLLLTAWILGAGCAQPTSIRLVVDTDLAPGVEADRFEVVVRAEGEIAWSGAFELDLAAELPQDLVVLPGDRFDDRVAIEVAARRGGELVLAAWRPAAFVAGRELEERVCLLRCCIGESDEPCLQGRCDGADGDADGDADADADGDADGDADADADGCTPDCTGRACGPDGCGGDCGGCEGGDRCCEGACADVSTDPDHCGDCGRPCRGALKECRGGACVCSSSTAEDCGAYCAETRGDPANCGGCGAVCSAAQDCEGAVCRAVLAGPVAPQAASGGIVCRTGESSGLGTVAVDEARFVYVLMQCGSEALVAVSTDGGLSYAAPVAIGGPSFARAALGAGPPGTAHVAAVTPGRELHHAVTRDAGATWTAGPVPDAAAADTSADLSVAVLGDALYVAIEEGSGVRVYRSPDGGASSFASTLVTTSSAYMDVLVDAATGHVWLAVESASFYIRRSADGGASFSVASRPAGTLYYSDWTLGGGTIFGGGTQTSYYAIETTAPASSRTIGGATRSDTRARALSADPAGNLFAVAGSGGEVVLDLVPAEASAVADSVRVDAGDFPCVAAFPGAEAAVVVYTRGDDVMAAVLEL